MADEITKVELFGANRDGDTMTFTCASNAYWTRGTLLILSDPRTVAIGTNASANTSIIAGIASMDKTYDFSTTVAVWENGVFEGTASGAITIGSPVVKALGGINRLETGVGVTGASGAAIVGYALEAASDGEKFTFRRAGIAG